jgi:hypothetical protein
VEKYITEVVTYSIGISNKRDATSSET